MRACKWSLACVHQMVAVQSERLGEFFVTVAAGIWASAAVAEDVLPQSSLGLEAFLALTA